MYRALLLSRFGGRAGVGRSPCRRGWNPGARGVAGTMAAALMMLALLPAPDVRGEGTPSLATGDPGTPGPGRWEINAAWMTSEAGGERTVQLPMIELDHGLGECCPLGYATALLIERDAANGKRSGLGAAIARTILPGWQVQR